MAASDECVTDEQRAALDEHRRDRATARIELGLDDDAGGLGLGVRPDVLEVGDDEERLEEILDAGLRLGGDVDELDLATPLRGLQATLGHLGADAVRIRAFLVDLVDRDGRSARRPPSRGQWPRPSAA